VETCRREAQARRTEQRPPALPSSRENSANGGRGPARRGGRVAVRRAAPGRSRLGARGTRRGEIGAARRPKGQEGTCGPVAARAPSACGSQLASRRNPLGSTSRVISLAPLYKRLTPWRGRLLRGRVRRWGQGGVCGSRLAYEAVAGEGDVTASYFRCSGSVRVSSLCRSTRRTSRRSPASCRSRAPSRLRSTVRRR
jgi:hypothetical protein